MEDEAEAEEAEVVEVVEVTTEVDMEEDIEEDTAEDTEEASRWSELKASLMETYTGRSGTIKGLSGSLILAAMGSSTPAGTAVA